MSGDRANCGHFVNTLGVVWITAEGWKAFSIFKKKKGKVVGERLFKLGATYKSEYHIDISQPLKDNERSICRGCLFEWKDNIYPYVSCQVGGIRELDSGCNIVKGYTKTGNLIKVFKGKCKNCPEAVIRNGK